MSIPTTARSYVLPKLGSYNDLTVRDTPIPALKPTEVLVKIHAVSLQFRDIIVAKKQYPLGALEENLTPGSDGAGEVIAVGEDVQNKWNIGDRVCSNFSTEHVYGDPTPESIASALGGLLQGVLTQYKIFPSHSLVKFPDFLSYEEASTLPGVALTAYNALNGPVPVKAGDYVLVQGTGGVSIFGLQLAVAAGATVIATSSSDEKLKIASRLGAKHVINYKTNPDWDKKVQEITKGRGVDHLIEIGGYGTLPRSLRSIRKAGWIHIIGFLSQDTPGPNEANLIEPILRSSAYIRGILIGSVAQFKDMNRLIAANNLKPVVDKVFPWESAIEAYKYLESQAHVGKVVIKVSEE